MSNPIIIAQHKRHIHLSIIILFSLVKKCRGGSLEGLNY